MEYTKKIELTREEIEKIFKEIKELQAKIDMLKSKLQ